MKPKDKVIFKHSKNNKNKIKFEVVEVKGSFVKIKPGSYGNSDMIVNKDDIQVIKS